MTSPLPPTTPAAEPPGWQPPPARPQLRRSRTDKVIGGVNGGLAEYTGIDALLWRVGFVALTIAAGTGLLVYLLLWLLMPAGPEGAAPAPGQPAPAARRREPTGPRSPIPGLTVAGLLIAVGFLALVSRLTGWDVEATGYLGTAVLVVGAGLVAAAFLPGRTARGGLVALGVVLSLALAIASATPSVDGGVGDRTFSPRTVAAVQEVYEGGVGDLTVDLSDVPMADLTDALDVRIEHGIGDVEVILPRSADAQIQVDQGVGETEVFGATGSGSDFHPGSGSAAWTDDGEPEFELEINSGIGDVEVSRG
ncbi:PspC domain-containing protein [Blastococcus xanthinilyticus]|uniref:Phage shock protein C (PspC) family protein n=1 Tax=Blastococcus xanthinilyticus TaxID=1564164 RepID=A0A5S5D149_9ACTN|nr:PspC domain-containing protein [Blastococcus xanthinilyticus]TYP89763.1 phage shock protein C (PspC) family protein [Blastococcus xanthinilyticus]